MMTAQCRLLALCSAAFLSPAWAQDPIEDPYPDATDAPQEARIHGRPAAQAPDLEEKAPRAEAAPPRDILGLSKRQCASFPSDLSKYRAYQQEKMLWNLRKIASLGGGYGIAACRHAREVFDAAACRRELDALYAKECGGQPGDADCAERACKAMGYPGYKFGSSDVIFE